MRGVNTGLGNYLNQINRLRSLPFFSFIEICVLLNRSVTATRFKVQIYHRKFVFMMKLLFAPY